MSSLTGGGGDLAAGEIREIGVGMLGYAFMGKAHSNALRKIAYMTWPPPLRPRLVAIAGRDAEAVEAAAGRYGYERWTTDWHDLVSDPEIGLLDNGGPNAVHAEPTILAAQAGKHVICEKPLGRDADESYEIWQQVAATGVKHMCALQLPLRSGRPARPRDRSTPASSARSATSAAATSRTGATIPRSTPGASTPTRPAPARSVTWAPTSSTWPATSSATSPRSRRW